VTEVLHGAVVFVLCLALTVILVLCLALTVILVLLSLVLAQPRLQISPRSRCSLGVASMENKVEWPICSLWSNLADLSSAMSLWALVRLRPFRTCRWCHCDCIFLPAYLFWMYLLWTPLTCSYDCCYLFPFLSKVPWTQSLLWLQSNSLELLMTRRKNGIWRWRGHQVQTSCVSSLRRYSSHRRWYSGCSLFAVAAVGCLLTSETGPMRF